MRVRYRYHRLHAADGEVARPVAPWKIALLLAALVLIVVLAIIVPALGAMLPLAELLLLVVAVVAGFYGAARMRHRVGAADEALQAAAARDAFWSPDVVRRRVESLFEPYWRAVQHRNVAAIAGDLSPRWRVRLDEAFAIWRTRGFKPVLFSLALNKVEPLAVDDRKVDAEDCFVALVECTTSYHVTDTNTGDVIEGFPDVRTEKQAWHFVRGERQWLLDRVERLATGGGVFEDLGFDAADVGS